MCLITSSAFSVFHTVRSRFRQLTFKDSRQGFLHSDTGFLTLRYGFLIFRYVFSYVRRHFRLMPQDRLYPASICSVSRHYPDSFIIPFRLFRYAVRTLQHFPSICLRPNGLIFRIPVARITPACILLSASELQVIRIFQFHAVVCRSGLFLSRKRQ